MKLKRFCGVFFISLLATYSLPLVVSAESLDNPNNLQVLIAQQPAKGIWDIPKDMPPPTGTQSSTADISSAPDNDIRIILLDIARKTKRMADLTIDKADDELTPVKPAGEVASHGGSGEALNQWAVYWENLSKGLDMSGKPIPRDQWRSMFEGADKLKQWQQYREWFASQADKLQRLGTAISIIDSGSKVAGALWEGEGKLAVITLADEVCKVGAVTFGTLFGTPWGPGGAIAGAFTGEELWRKFGSPKFEQRAQFVKNMEIWNQSAGDTVRRKIGSLPEFDDYMEGRISEAEFRAKIRVYAEHYKKEREEKKKQHDRELELLRKQAQVEPRLKELIDTWQAGKLPKSQKTLLIEALRRAIRAQKGPSAKAGDEFECKIDEPLPPSSPTTTPKDPDKNKKSAAPKEKTDLFGDLCGCSCNSGVGGASKFDASAGCVCTGVLGGEWTVPMVSSGECFANSAKAAGKEESRLRETVKNMNMDWAEKLIQKAKDLVEDFWTALPGLSLGKSSKAGTPETLKERVERKLNEEDIDKAEGYAKAAIEMYPPLEPVAKAVIPGSLSWRLDKLALSFVPSLDFSTSRRILERTIKLDEKNKQVQESLKKVAQWEKEWNQIKSLSENCFSLIKSKRVCECQKLFDGKIEPLNNSFRIPTGGMQPGRVLDDGRTIMEREYLPIPEKDALRLKLALELDNSRRGCRYQPWLNETVFRLESYTINKAGPGLSDQAIADMAKKVLEREGLCDCEREVAEKALEIANKGIAEQGPPLKVSLQATKTVIKKGESVELTPTISGGSPPYNFSYMGNWAFDVTGGAITGQGQTTTSLRAKIVGAHPLDISVTDAKGQTTSGRIVLNVIEDTASKPMGETTKLDVSLMADKNMLNIGESSYIAAAVTGGKPPYKVKWSGAVSGEGATMLFKARKSGSSIIYAESTDSDGNKGSASIVITVEEEKISAKKPPQNDTPKKSPSNKIGKSKIIVLGSKPETSSSPLNLKVPQGEQSQTLLFTYEHKNVETGRMAYVMEAPSNTTFMIEPSDSGASITRISNPAKWGEEKFFAVVIDKDVKPGKKFTLTAYYSGVPNPQWISNKYLDTGEDAEEYKKKNVKPATAVIEVIGDKLTPGKTDTGYDPTKDINIQSSGKQVDTAQIDKISDDFQKGQHGSKKPDDKTDQQSATPQSDAYTGKTQTAPASTEETSYPPAYPPQSNNTGKTKDWTDWATKGTSKGTGPTSSASSNTTSTSTSASSSSSTASSGSTSGSSGTSGQTPAVMAELSNKGGENIHIFVEGQDSFGSQNKLAPGEKRKVSIKVPQKGGFVKFIAGRNGQKLAECRWEYLPDSIKRVPVVSFNDPNKLSCATGLR